MDDIILEMRDITKTFPGVKALNNVNLRVASDHIHALVGENGAGKSTLINILSGVYPDGSYEGEILFRGEECRFKSIKDSENKGIAVIHQELALVPYLSIAENIFLGNENSRYTVIDWHKTLQDAAEVMRKVGLYDKPGTLIKDIGVGKQQLVEIAKALSKKITLLVLDEPTAALNENDSNNLLNLLLELKKDGISSVIISHKLNEVSAVADEITIIRDGAVIETLVKDKDDIGEGRIIKGMVGRTMTDRFPKRDSEIGPVYFEVKNWTVQHPLYHERTAIRNVSFAVRKGEVIGFAGLVGAGRTELAMSVFGRSWGRNITGEVWKDGKRIAVDDVSAAIENGIAYVPEDRKTSGLILIDSIRSNIALPNLKSLSRHTVVDEKREILVSEDFRKRLDIKTPSIEQKTGNLSGGNQQKVVLAKWILSQPDVFILDEPTRGIDVGTKYEIYCIINQLAQEGKAVIMISSELPEILGMCDRVYVMNEGAIVGELARDEASQERIMHCIMQNVETQG